MAGNRRRRHRHRRRAVLPKAEPSPPVTATLSPNEVTNTERPPKKTCQEICSASTPSFGPQVWADLLDSLLHQIIGLVSSFQDFLAFTSTCHTWRAAVSSFPSVYTFTFPPLHLKPDFHYTQRHFRSVKYNFSSNYQWKLRDPTKTNLSLRCSAPQNTQIYMHFLGCSFGYLIFSCREQCLLVDVYTGTKLKPPKLLPNNNVGTYYGTLVVPPNSSNLCLLLCSRTSMLQWQVGTNIWAEHPLGGERILQIVSFRGQIFAMDVLQRLHTIRLAPELSMQELAVVWGDDMVIGMNSKPWLVVCGDMLLMVDFLVSFDQLTGFSATFQVFYLDLSVQPAVWVKMDKLENWALFVSLDRRCPSFSCMNPERWGGKSNCIYVPSASEDSDKPWTAVELGQTVPSTTHPVAYGLAGDGHCRQLESLWVLPSLVYGVSR